MGNLAEIKELRQKGLTYQAIGDMFGVSRQRIHRIAFGYGSLRKSLGERFWARVDKSGECWEWQGGYFFNGYGQFHLEGRPQRAHRVCWELTFGSIPNGLCVLHHCDNKPCVNPDHLWLGTYADNAADMVRKGRHAGGRGCKGKRYPCF